MMEKGRSEHIPAAGMEKRNHIDRATFSVDQKCHSGIDTIPEQHFVGVKGSFGETGSAGCVLNLHSIGASNLG